MFEVLNRAPSIDAQQPGLEPDSVKGEIELRNVAFAYVSRGGLTPRFGLFRIRFMGLLDRFLAA